MYLMNTANLAIGPVMNGLDFFEGHYINRFASLAVLGLFVHRRMITNLADSPIEVVKTD